MLILPLLVWFIAHVLRGDFYFIIMYKQTSYSEKLKDPRWQKKRLEIFQRDDFTCRRCKCKDKTLHVHHNVYIDGIYDPWMYDDILLITLCGDCHKYEEANKEKAIDELMLSLRIWLLTDDIKKIKKQILKKVRKLHG